MINDSLIAILLRLKLPERTILEVLFTVFNNFEFKIIEFLLDYNWLRRLWIYFWGATSFKSFVLNLFNYEVAGLFDLNDFLFSTDCIFYNYLRSFFLFSRRTVASFFCANSFFGALKVTFSFSNFLMNAFLFYVELFLLIRVTVSTFS